MIQIQMSCSMVIRTLWVALPYILFGILSSRSDMLFIDSSQMHWEYYVGVIRSVRSGGWLLFDTPSQYGFLPILLAVLLPVKSSWNAFFFLHAASLLAASILFYQGAIIFCRLPRILAAALVIATVFFSYPGLISPTAYPSSGPMRFLWCYVLLFFSGLIFTGENRSPFRFAKIGAFLWIAGVFWSAESAVYCTAIYFSPIGLTFLSIFFSQPSSYLEGRNKFGAILGLLGPAILCVSVAGIGISAFYICSLGVWPDWSMHFAYAFAYASGFGGLDIPFNGPIWLIVLLLLVGFIAISLNIKNGTKDSGGAMLAVSATACIWSISSYYLGRSVPNNIVAIYPVLSFALLLLLRSWPKEANSSILIAISTPFFFLALLSPLANQGLADHLAGMQVLSLSIGEKTAAADSELTGIMNEAQLSTESPVTYYGHDAAMPRSAKKSNGENFEKAWLPNPLQLLEEPIPEQKQREIITRWSSRRTEGGYLVQKKGQAEDRFARWLQLLNEDYILVNTWESPNYRIFLFSRKKT